MRPISSAVWRATWLEVLRSPVRLGLVACLLLPGWITAAFGKHGEVSSGRGTWLALILGAGLIGRAVSNGTLALVFSRPLRRADYLLTRWLAVTVLASLFAAVNLLAIGFGQWSELPVAIGEDILCAAGMTAVLALLSSLIGGLGDAALLAFLFVASNLTTKLGEFLSKPALTWIGRHVSDSIVPTLDLKNTFLSTPISWFALCAYLSTVALCLTGAVELLRRKEISYAGGGD